LSRRPRHSTISRLTQTTVGTAYREWLLAQAVREAHSGCARLKRVLDELPAYFSEQTAGWCAKDVEPLMRARIKGMQWGPPLRPLVLTPEEQKLSATIEWPVLSPDMVSRTKVLWELRRRYMQGDFRLDRKDLRRQVKTRLDRLLGKPRLIGGGFYRYLTASGDVLVYSDIDFPTKGTGQLRYGQCVVAQTDEDRVVGYADDEMLLTGSLFNLLGFPLTQWSCLTPADVPTAVDTLADLCIGFIEEVPKIVQAAMR
jgi:hypothetical protein